MSFLSRFINNLTWPIRTFLSSPMAVFSAPRKVMGLSLPFRLALFSLLFLILCTVLGCVLFWVTENRAAWEVYWRSAWLIGILLIVIPIAVYKVTQAWLEGEPSRFPKIDHAWKAGIEALKEHHLDITEVPLFLVTGLEDDRHARHVMQASELSFSVNGVPEGPAPVHWYANDAAIFLCLTQVTCVGRLFAKFGSASVSENVPAGAPRAKAIFSETMTLANQPGRGPTETADFLNDAPVESEEIAPPPVASERGFTGTIGVVNPESLFPGGAQASTDSRGAAVARLNDKERRETEEQLDYVLDKLRVAREPFAPVNGALSLVPFPLVRHSAQQSSELGQAAAGDIELIRTTLQVRCAVSVVVDGMESEKGFRELARRIGRETVKKNRFGKGNPEVWTAATGDNVEAIARHACGAFEDWTYHLFGTPGGLSKVGNTKLYSLLCLVRTQIQDRLINVLCQAYGRDSDEAHRDPHSMLFSGCYFAATGDSDDKQAFIKSVFEKLVEQEEKLCWTDEALTTADRYRMLGGVANVLNLVLILAIVGIFVGSRTDLKETLARYLGW